MDLGQHIRNCDIIAHAYCAHVKTAAWYVINHWPLSRRQITVLYKVGLMS